MNIFFIWVLPPITITQMLELEARILSMTFPPPQPIHDLFGRRHARDQRLLAAPTSRSAARPLEAQDDRFKPRAGLRTQLGVRKLISQELAGLNQTWCSPISLYNQHPIFASAKNTCRHCLLSFYFAMMLSNEQVFSDQRAGHVSKLSETRTLVFNEFNQAGPEVWGVRKETEEKIYIRHVQCNDHE